MGEIHEIPINQQGNEALISNYQRIHFRVEADSTILEFHNNDVAGLKQSILIDTIGEGYGESYKGQAINEDQVRSNFDDQESNLNHFKHRIESSWEFILNRVGELVAPESFEKTFYRLGTKFFLKTVDQLYMELEQIYKGSNNSSIIQDKQLEILLTENQEDVDSIQRYDMIRVLKPFSTFPLSYVEGARQSLETRQPRTMLLYDNFDQVLSIFEARNGRLENMVIDEFNTDLLINNLFSIFGEILNELLQANGETITGGGSGQDD
jgi:hypothetical protein